MSQRMRISLSPPQANQHSRHHGWCVPSESPDGPGYLEHLPTLISTDDQVCHRRLRSSPGYKERSLAPTWYSVCSDRRYPDATEALKELDEQLGPANGVCVSSSVTATSLHPDKTDLITY
jgi:hypothetical protein